LDWAIISEYGSGSLSRFFSTHLTQGNTIMPQSPAFYAFDDMPFEKISDKISRRYVYGKNVMLVYFKLQKGAIVRKHHHESEQITYILKGAVKVTSQDKDYIVRAGEVLVIPSQVEHFFEALEDTIDLDVFSPIRQDWLDHQDDYLR
jgi:quercetin dioxygenase-like cupin family protein